MPEKYAEFLGEGYHKRIRDLLGADEILLPGSMIDADMNIGAMKMILTKRLGTEYLTGGITKTTESLELLREVAIYALAAVLCVMLKSRTRAPNFAKYRRNWDKKNKKLMNRFAFAAAELEGR